MVELKMTDFQPKPQTPEQVADGLRNAFRQAIKDGVMDATPYLKQMTYKSDIEKTEAEIKVLQKKLELLKEIETHKSQPRMEAERSGEVHIVFYNKKTYYRIEYTDEYGYVVWWRREKQDDTSRLVMITDKETERLLEGLWFNEVKGGKYD
jgi:methionyl-tRNA formyltransferase